ncbi:MAG: hypothetical protein IJZ84_03745 [Lachnospiraceae bacterium]|nr:hypothetical protein [Lachnospiraceae bacterium]
MKRVRKGLLPVVKGFLYCFVGLQIVLGLCYIGNQFMTVPLFRDTSIYLEMTEQFVMDEYTGLLYPLIVKICHSIFQEFYYIPIYLLQLMAGLFCVYHFICAFTEKKMSAAICALWLNTIPFVAQVHVTVLPHSLAFTCLVLMLLEVVKGTVYRRPLLITEWAVLLCSFTILAQLTRGYLWIGLAPVIWAVCLQLYAKTHKVLMCLVTFWICVGITVCNLAIYYGTETEGYYGRIQNTPQAVFFQRTAIPILSEKYMIYMPEEITECFTGAELAMFGRYPYKLQNEMGPVLEARYGKEWAAEIYVELGCLGVETAAKDNLRSLTEDALSYAMPQLTYGTWRDGEVKGMTSWNYQQFTQEVPVLATAYSNICHKLWLVGSCLAVVMLAVSAWQRKSLLVRVWLPTVIFLAIYGLLFALRGTDLYDYKLAVLPMVLGYAPMCCILFLKKEKV